MFHCAPGSSYMPFSRHLFSTRRQGLIIAMVLCALAGAGAGITIFKLLSGKPENTRFYAEQRLSLINRELSSVTQDYAMTAGDSHAELILFRAEQCPDGKMLPIIVEGAVSGAGVELYRQTFERMEFIGKPKSITLSIGTNDLLRKRKPLSAERQEYFKSQSASLLRGMQSKAYRVLVFAVPPMDELASTIRDASGVQVYSDVLKGFCQAPGCHFIDPYEASRRPDHFGLARKGAMSPDGIHMQSYDSSFAAISADLCASGNAGN